MSFTLPKMKKMLTIPVLLQEDWTDVRGLYDSWFWPQLKPLDIKQYKEATGLLFSAVPRRRCCIWRGHGEWELLKVLPWPEIKKKQKKNQGAKDN